MAALDHVLGALFSERLAAVGSSPCTLVPPASVGEMVLARCDKCKLHGSSSGLLLLTQLRVLFVPGFIDIAGLAADIMGGTRGEMSAAEMSTALKSRGVVGDLEGFVQKVDANGDGSLSRAELVSFLETTARGEFKGSVVQMPAAHIVDMGLAKSGSAESDDDESEGLAFAAGAVTAEVVSHNTKQSSRGSYVSYRIQVTAAGEQSSVGHRFSDFAALRAELAADGVASLPPLPPKTRFFAGVDSDVRQQALDAFVKELLGVASARGAVLADFLGATARLRAAERLAGASSEQRVADAIFTQGTAHDHDSSVDLILSTKLGEALVFRLPQAESGAALAFAQKATTVAKAGNFSAAFPEAHGPSSVLSGAAMMRAEYKRLGAEVQWRLIENEDYSVCSSYPQVFAVPILASDESIATSAAQRSKGRLPALTWLHPNGTPLCRSAQPLAGLKGVNGKVVEWGLLEAIRDSVPTGEIVVIDARPRLNAQANALAGKGFEDVSGLKGGTIEFMDIDNIHAMRASLALLGAACRNERDGFHSGLAKSKWLTHVKQVCLLQVISVLQQSPMCIADWSCFCCRCVFLSPSRLSVGP